jgi:hypothetical protein
MAGMTDNILIFINLDFSPFPGINQNFVIASISEATQSSASSKFCTGLLHFARNDDMFSSFFKNGQTPVNASNFQLDMVSRQ